MFKKFEVSGLEILIANLCALFMYVVIGKVAYELGKSSTKNYEFSLMNNQLENYI